MYSEKRRLGNIGEDIVAKDLVQKGYRVISRNYLKKWGEIDIVARGTDQQIHFVEVKTVSREKGGGHISRDTWRPEDNVHYGKLQRMHRTIESWLQENTYEGEWCVDVATVTIYVDGSNPEISYIENII